MAKRLLSFLNTYLFALLLLPLVVVFTPVQSSGQSAGDVAFIGFNVDGDEGFAVVLLTSYSAGEEIHFAEEEWNGSGFSSTEGDFTWEAPEAGVSAGTVLVFDNVSDSGTISVNIGSLSSIAQMSLSSAGEVIYAYSGTDKFNPDIPLLGAIATDTDLYDQPDGTEGTLANSGLTKGTTAILLSNNIDVAEFTGDRSGNTPNGYLTELNNIGSNWQEEDGSGDQGGLILPFDDTSFTIVPAPTLAFAVARDTVAESSGSTTLTVELVEANSNAVNVDVAFLSNSSSADLTDIDSYSTTNVSFGSGRGSGDTETVTVNLDPDGSFEGTEKAVFQLQNNTAGSIISPDVLTLTIDDNDAPDIYINEVHADPSNNGTDGDADGNGVGDSSDDEFLEFVNSESTDIDISGWTVSDGTLRHTFPEGTTIPANGTLVLFADDGVKPEGGFGGAVIQSSNESTTLSLNNGGDTIILNDADGNQVISLTYPSAGNNQSIVRTGDADGGVFVDHSGASGSGGALFSPGTQIDGTAFGGGYAIGIRGGEGWRMISSPTSGTTFNDLFADIWIQGITGSDAEGGAAASAKNLITWDETTGTFTSPSNMSDNMTAGRGYAVYVFEDDDIRSAGVQGGFPKVINTDKTENGNINIGITATDQGSNGIDGNEGFNLLGNPFGTDLSVTALIDALETADASAAANIQVYDHEAMGGQGGYVTLSDGDLIAPFQAFWIQYTTEITGASNTEVNFNRTSLAANTGTDFLKQTNNTRFEFNISLHGQKFFDPFHIEFSEKGSLEFDKYDASKLFSLNPNAINLYGLSGTQKLLKNTLPYDLEEIIEIPLAFDAPNRNKLTFRWNGIRELPQHWDVTLIDRTLGRELDLRRDEEYTFTFQQAAQQKAFGEEETLYKKTPAENGDVRFVLKVNPGQIENSNTGNLPSSNQLNPNYPNPFNPTTTISYSLTQQTQVKISVWNIVGQKVATLVDGVVEAGTHTELWNASDMPSGIYIAQMEVGGNVFIRKMTLIK